MRERTTITRRRFLRRSAGCAGVVGACRALASSSLYAQGRLADPAALKIRRIDPYVLRIGGRENIVCVRVETEEGIHGWGEGTTPPNVAPVVAQIRSFRKLLIGESAWDIEKLWRRMYIVEENSLGGTLYAAISAIDIALWDIVAKKLNVPVYKLLGGKVHDRLRLYTSYRWGNIPRTREAYRANERKN